MEKYVVENSFNLPIFKYRYSNGVTVYSPLKCGHRWLMEETKWEECTEIRHRDINSENVDGQSFFIYRSPIDHLNSAIFTEITSRLNSVLLYEIITHIHHWTPTLYRDLSWNLKEGSKMRFVPLEYLQKWFQNTMGKFVTFDKDRYDFTATLGVDRDVVVEMIKKSYKEIYHNHLLEAIIDKDVMLDLVEKYPAPLPSVNKVKNGII